MVGVLGGKPEGFDSDGSEIVPYLWKDEADGGRDFFYTQRSPNQTVFVNWSHPSSFSEAKQIQTHEKGHGWVVQTYILGGIASACEGDIHSIDAVDFGAEEECT